MEETLIQNVSDTALWIAAYRAEETKRKDAVFQDLLAEKLAGEKGFNIIRKMPHTKSMAFAMVVRTVAIDDLVLSAIEKGVNTIINLGAGLDTRPYRLKIPDHIKWIEVDFPAMIDYKNKMLENDQPVCLLQRLKADLTNDLERRRLFTELSDPKNSALIITEGVIAYLKNEDAAKLSEDLFKTVSFNYWIMDYAQGRHRKSKQTKDLEKNLVNAKWEFDHDDPINFFGAQGWRVYEKKYILDEADKMGRQLPLTFPINLAMKVFPKKLRALGNKTYGYVMFGR